MGRGGSWGTRAALAACFWLGSSCPGEDCNRNGSDDEFDILQGLATDCDESGIPDECEVFDTDDCNRNFIHDSCEIRDGTSEDCNQNGIPDECDTGRLDLAPARRHPAGFSPVGFQAGDLDGDGDLDLAALKGSFYDLLPWTAVAVFWNDGSGGFVEAVSFPTGHTARWLLLQDVDGDRALDLLTVSASAGTLAVLLQGGGGRFEAPLEVPAGFRPSGVAAADLDGDGKPELALSGGPNGSVLSILWNEGGGWFGGPVDLPLGLQRFSIAATGDFDGDRTVDLLLVNNHPPKWWFLSNRGGGAFDDAVQLALPDDLGVLLTADLDGDGDLDLAGGNPDNQDLATDKVWVLLNAGDATFPHRVGYGIGGWRWEYVRFADLDGDRDPDLLGAPWDSQSVGILWNKGDGSFSGPLWLDQGGDISRECTPADFDGDGAADLVIRGWNHLKIHFSTPDRLFSRRKQWLLGEAPSSVVAADLDGDGRLELAVGNFPGGVTVLHQELDGTFAPLWDYLGPGRALASGDLDRDGDVDLAAAEGASVGVRLNRGDGRFFPAVIYPGLGTCVATGDVDGDSDLDLVLGNGTLLNRGDGTFEPPRMRRGTGHALSLGDLDGDGDLDLASVRWNGNRVYISLNDGTGAFGAPLELVAGKDTSGVAAGDFDQDGDLDLAASHRGTLSANGLFYTGSGLTVFRNLGKGSFVTPQSMATTANPVALEAADLDGDGWVDLAAAIDHRSRGVAVFLNRGEGRFLDPQGRIFGRSVRALTLGDLDGDGDSDLAAVDTEGFSVAVLENRSLPALGLDRNGNRVPDDCERALFRRGDPDSSGAVEVADAIQVLSHLFLGGAAPGCLEAADLDNDGRLGLEDAIGLLNYLFQGGPPPAPPGPPPGPCGLDPDPAGSPADLGCLRYTTC